MRFLARIHEAKGGGSPSARVVIITEGLGNVRDRNVYLPSAVKSAATIFKGKQFYCDHPSSDEEQTRPERSVRDLAGYFSETSVGTMQDANTGETLTACFATLKFAQSETGRLAQGQVKTALQYQRDFPDSKDVYCGISINAGGVSEPGEVDGMAVNLISEITEAFSADIVTKPARGGKFLALVESRYGSRKGRRFTESQRRAMRAHQTFVDSYYGGVRSRATSPVDVFKESYRRHRAR
jgi:hypothetical protein